jgi:PAS domain S-box-containing protein
LLSDCQKVIQDSATIQSKVDADNARLYLRRILPYRSHGDQQAGVVIMFVDLADRLSLEHSLTESKESLQAILDSAADAILTINGEGIIKSLNPVTERLFGYPHDKVLGSSVLSLLTADDLGGSHELTSIGQLPMSNYCTSHYRELLVTRKDCSCFATELTGSRVDHLSLFIVLIRDVSRRKDLQSKILSITSDHQRRIGKELHDANQHVQSLSHGIMPVQIDASGLQSELMELANETTVEDKLVCRFVHSGSMTITSNAKSTYLYRIAQESINNAQRHGAAKEIKVSLSGDEHQIELQISDDGIGTDTLSMKSSGKLNHGTGLQIMEYRAAVIGGKLSISAGVNNGTIVTCTVPWQRVLL